jgi:putrescine transport system substrate-binding protein
MEQCCFLRRVVWGLCAIFAAAMPVGARDTQLNIYNWSDYIASDTVSNFEKQTGIKVNYDVYDSNDTLHAKLLAGNSGYDIVVPTTNYAGRQIAAGVFAPLDKTKLPNLKYLDPELMALISDADPGNRYLVPWAYQTTGLGYNVTKVKQILGPDVPLDSWDIFFNPKYISKLKRCGVSMLDAPDDGFAVALHYLGLPPDSTHPADYRRAAQLLKKIRPFITSFNSSSYLNELADDDICLAFGWSNDIKIAAHRAQQAKRNYQIEYHIPSSGAPIYFDVMAIPKDAPHKEAALKWINYIETPQVHARITNKIFAASANRAAKQYLDPLVANDLAIHPTGQMVSKLFLLKPMPPEIMRLMMRLWTGFKTGH